MISTDDPQSRTTAGSHTPPGVDPLASNKSSEELQQDIRQTRSALDDKLDALSERLNPKAWVGDFASAFQGEGSGIAQKLVDNVKRNPLPAAMVGAGLAWLFLTDSDTRGPGRKAIDHYRDSHHGSESSYQGGYLLRSQSRGFPLTDEEQVAADAVESVGQGPNAYSYEPLNDEELETIDNDFPDYRAYQEAELEIVRLQPDDDSEDAQTKRSTFKAAREKASAAASAAMDKAKQTGGASVDLVKRASARVSDTASSLGSGIRSGASATASGVGSAGSSVASGLSSAGSGIASGVSSAGSGIASGVSSAGSGIASAASSTGQALSSATSQAAESAKSGVQSAAEAVHRSSQQAPLATGLAALAVGVIAGLLLPGTRKENELMGEYADDLKDAAKDAAADAADRAQSTAAATAAAAMERGKELGLKASDFKAKSERIAEAGRQAMAEAAREEGLAPDQLKDKAAEVVDHTKSQATEHAKQHAQDSKVAEHVSN